MEVKTATAAGVTSGPFSTPIDGCNRLERREFRQTSLWGSRPQPGVASEIPREAAPPLRCVGGKGGGSP
jgi:hypothetical protein